MVEFGYSLRIFVTIIIIIIKMHVYQCEAQSMQTNCTFNHGLLIHGLHA